MRLPGSPYFIRQIDRDVKALVLNPRIGHRLRLPRDSSSNHPHIYIHLRNLLCASLKRLSYPLPFYCVFILNRDSDYEYNERFFRALAAPFSSSSPCYLCFVSYSLRSLVNLLCMRFLYSLLYLPSVCMHI